MKRKYLFQEPYLSHISSYKENVVVYMAGYVGKMVKKKIRCQTCAGALTCSRFEAENNASFALLNRKRWGQLVDSSSDVIAICIETERLFVFLEKQGQLTTLSSISSKISRCILKHLFLRTD